MPHAAGLYPGKKIAGTDLASLNDVDEAAAALFHEKGYLVVEQGYSAEELEAASQGIDRVLNGESEECMARNHLMIEPQLKDNAGLPLRDKVRKITVPNSYDERIKALCFHPALVNAVARIIGEEPFMFQDMALVKPPHVGSEKPWHQDNAYFNIPPETTVVGAWIAIDAATVENGCMHILPGSHREGPRLHFRVRDWQICDTDMDVAEEVAVPLKRGGVLLFHGLMNHGTPDNLSDSRRRALQFHFRPASVQPISEEDRLKVFGGQGRGAVC